MSRSVLRAEAKAFNPKNHIKSSTNSSLCLNSNVDDVICCVKAEQISTGTSSSCEHDLKQRSIDHRSHENNITDACYHIINDRSQKVPSSVSSSLSNAQKLHNGGNSKQKGKTRKWNARKHHKNPTEAVTKHERNKEFNKLEYQQVSIKPLEPPLCCNDVAPQQQFDSISRKKLQIGKPIIEDSTKRNNWLKYQQQNSDIGNKSKHDPSSASKFYGSSSEPRTTANHDENQDDPTSHLPESGSTVFHNKNIDFPWLNAVTRQISSSHITCRHEFDEKIDQSSVRVETELSFSKRESSSLTDFIILRRHQPNVPALEKQAPDTNDSIETDDAIGPVEGKSDLNVESNMSILASRFKSSRHIDMTKLRNRWWDLLQKHHETKQYDESDLDDNLDFGTKSQLCLCDEQVMAIVSRSRASPIVLQFDSAPTVAPDDVGVSIMKDQSSSLSLSNRSLLIKAIRANHIDAIRKIIEDNRSTSELMNILQEAKDVDESQTEKLSPVQVAVTLNRPQILEMLLQSFRFLQLDGNGSNYERVVTLPLFLASENGYDECLNIILNGYNTAVSTLLILKDDDGNTVMHFCCRQNVTISTFQLVFDYATKGSNGRSMQLLAKMLSNKNLRQQTPLHVACTFNRGDVIDFVLTKMKSITTTAKLLSIQDDEGQTPFLAAVSSGSTDIVMSLLMWRGNNSRHNCFRYSLPSNSKGNGNNEATMSNISFTSSASNPPCPLIWAITRTVNVDMIMLLIEFNNPLSDQGYDLDVALRYATNIRFSFYADGNVWDEKFQSVLTIIRVLIEAGANPCIVLEAEKMQQSLLESFDSTAVATSARYGDYDCLVLMFDTYRHVLTQMQHKRRRDPTLQKQPESFFLNLESREENELNLSIRDALVTSLYHCWEVQEMSHPQKRETCSHYNCCLVLYRRGAKLTPADLERLKNSMIKRMLIQPNSEMFGIHTNIEFNVTNRILIPRVLKKKDSLGYLPTSSWLMLHMPWFPSRLANSCGCSWMENCHSRRHETDSIISGFGPTDIVLHCQDGAIFQCHSLLVSEKSHKIAAAIRFASLSVANEHMVSSDLVTPTENGKLLEVPLDIPSKMLRWMLEHIYHGSIIVGRFSKRSQTEYFEALLELLLCADEFLCPSLVQECEMRLLAVDYRKCFCWYCNSTQESDSVIQNLGDQRSLWMVKEYSFVVAGPSSLISVENALDILAVAQQLSMSCDVATYTVGMETMEQIVETEVLTKVSYTPLEALRNTAVTCMVHGLGSVFDNKSFKIRLQSLILEGISEPKLSEQSLFKSLLKILLCELHGLTPQAKSVVLNFTPTVQVPQLK